MNQAEQPIDNEANLDHMDGIDEALENISPVSEDEPKEVISAEQAPFSMQEGGSEEVITWHKEDLEAIRRKAVALKAVKAEGFGEVDWEKIPAEDLPSKLTGENLTLIQLMLDSDKRRMGGTGKAA